ncbi:MAG: AAA family ATPase [Bacteroidota bacterium]
MYDFTKVGIIIPAHSPSGEIRTICPKCSASRKKKQDKCLSVNTQLGLWFCHHCQWRGSIANQPGPTQHHPNHQTIHLGEREKMVRKDFSKTGSKFWQEYRISLPLLDRFKVFEVSHIQATNRMGKPYAIHATEKAPFFAYEVIPQKAYKIYQPFGKLRFRWLGQKPKEYVFGLDQLPADGKLLLLTGGEKDVLTLAYLGYHAISLNSETSLPSKELIQHLKTRFNTVGVLYDQDETGRSMTQKLAKSFGLLPMQLPPMDSPHKDISDYIRYAYDLTALSKALNTSYHSTPKSSHILADIDLLQPPQVLPMNALLKRHQTEPIQQHLYLGIPPVSFGYVVGPPKSGKTTFCEGLAFSIASGEDSYLDEPIRTENRKVLFLSLEEFWKNRIQRNQQQIQRLIDLHHTDWLGTQIHLIDEQFPPNLITDQDWQLVQQAIESIQPSVVFIDSLSRCYMGSIEDSRTAKQITTRLRQLVEQYQICLIIIHHTPKQIGRPLTIDSIAGSRILAQEADFALGVSKTPQGQRYIKEIFYRYAQEQDEVKVFEFSEDLWIEVKESTPESSLLHEEQEPQLSDMKEELWTFIHNHLQNHPHIDTKLLMKEFVQTGEYPKSSLFRAIKKWQKDGRLVKIRHGIYEQGNR